MVSDSQSETESGRLNHLFKSADTAKSVAAQTGGEVIQGPHHVFVKAKDQGSGLTTTPGRVEYLGVSFPGDPNALGADRAMNKLLEVNDQPIFDLTRETGGNPKQVANEVQRRTGVQIGPKLEAGSVGRSDGGSEQIEYYALQRDRAFRPNEKQIVGVVAIRRK